MQGGASLVPGVNFYSQGFVSNMSVHGSATADQRIYFDGMRIGQNLTGTGSQANGTGVNDFAQEELVFDAGSQYFFSSAALQNENVPDDLSAFIRGSNRTPCSTTTCTRTT